MIEFLLALAVVALLITGMAVGVLLGRKPLAGSCGGMTALGMEVACDICAGDVAVCEEIQAENKKHAEGNSKVSDLAYDATREH
ncbi:MAG: (Na+)-NQR maturation NqrM [Porticoccaceae bacterium]